jgi:hypothetical protein
MAKEQITPKPKGSLRKRARTSGQPESGQAFGGVANWDAVPKCRVDGVGRGDRNIAFPVAHAAQAQPIWISVAAAAERGGVNPRTIKRWISNGWLSAVRLPSLKGMGQLRVRLGDVDALIARGALS